MWVVLTNTTKAVFMPALDGSIVIIALPRSEPHRGSEQVAARLAEIRAAGMDEALAARLMSVRPAASGDSDRAPEPRSARHVLQA